MSQVKKEEKVTALNETYDQVVDDYERILDAVNGLS